MNGLGMGQEQRLVMCIYDDWHEDYGNCLWFHFDDFESPPEVIFSCPHSSDFEEGGDGYWTHFSRIDSNSVFDQVQQQAAKPENEEILK